MEIKLTKIYTTLLGICILFAAMSCQTEQLNLNDDLSEADQLLKKGEAKTPEFDPCDYSANEVKLIAGQFTEVGKVTVEEDGDYYKITYLITVDGYCITETHLSVVNSTSDFPISNGGPKNGHFEYSNSHDCETIVEYMVPINNRTYIAAHAVVNCKSIDDEFSENIESLPLTEQVCVTAKGDGNSYFDINIGGESFLAGNYDAWCIDLYKDLDNDQCFDANIYSLYDENVDGAVDKPENIGAVNWIVNQDFISQGYTFGEIQWAIWELLEDNNEPAGYCCLGTWEESNGQEIVDMALENLDFEPACGELMGIAILPTSDAIQPVMISIPIPCDYDCEETAWGAANGEGCKFPGSNWATYFQYAGIED